MDQDWLEEFIAQLPKAETKSKNIFDISGFPNWENVNSNFLAFYLTETEDHKFNRLFIDSLIDCLEDKTADDSFERTIFESSFRVYREYGTSKGRIDILLESDSEINEKKQEWAIIIENKIYHHLGNDLNDYWKAVDAKKIVGIVLSPWEIEQKKLKIKNKETFVNITHQEYVEKIKSNLHIYFDHADSRHLLFLKEYFLNINSLYESPMKKNKLAQQLIAFHENRENIEEIINLNDQLLRYLNEEIESAFEAIEYYAESSNTSRAKHYYYDWEDENIPKGAEDFRFWVDINRLRYHNTFECIFELYDQKNVPKGLSLLKKLKSTINTNKSLTFADENQSTKHQFHLFFISFPLDGFETIGYASKIENELKEILHWNKESDLLFTCYAEWSKLIS